MLDGVALTDPSSNFSLSGVGWRAIWSALVSAAGWSTAEITTSSSDSFIRCRRDERFFRSTPSVKKTRRQTLGHNFTNYYPIFKFFSLADSVVNLQ